MSPSLLKNANVLRGLFLIAIALFFGVGALNYKFGSFSKAGPGLFPLMMSVLLLLLGVLTLVKAYLQEPHPVVFKLKNLSIILLALGSFVVLSELINMSVGIVGLVFIATLAGTSYSVVRNIKIAVGLLAIAFMFHELLGLNLPLY